MARADNKQLRAAVRDLEGEVAKVELQCEKLLKTSALLRPPQPAVPGAEREPEPPGGAGGETAGGAADEPAAGT